MFIRHAKLFPFYTVTGWRPNAHTLRKVVGVTEVVCGIVLAMIPGTKHLTIKLHIMSCVTLSIKIIT